MIFVWILDRGDDCNDMLLNKLKKILFCKKISTLLVINKMKNKAYDTVGIVLKFNRKMVEKGNIDTHNTQMHDRSLSWVGRGTEINSGGVRLALWSQTFLISEAMLPCNIVFILQSTMS